MGLRAYFFVVLALLTLQGSLADWESSGKNLSWIYDIKNSVTTQNQTYKLNSETGAFRYHFDVSVVDSYKFETQSSDAVTMGCYGWKDAVEKWHPTNYVADSHGWRTVRDISKPIDVYPEYEAHTTRTFLDNLPQCLAFMIESAPLTVFVFTNHEPTPPPSPVKLHDDHVPRGSEHIQRIEKPAANFPGPTGSTRIPQFGEPPGGTVSLTSRFGETGPLRPGPQRPVATPSTPLTGPPGLHGIVIPPTNIPSRKPKERITPVRRPYDETTPGDEPELLLTGLSISERTGGVPSLPPTPFEDHSHASSTHSPLIAIEGPSPQPPERISVVISEPSPLGRPQINVGDAARPPFTISPGSATVTPPQYEVNTPHRTPGSSIGDRGDLEQPEIPTEPSYFEITPGDRKGSSPPLLVESIRPPSDSGTPTLIVPGGFPSKKPGLPPPSLGEPPRRISYGGSTSHFPPQKPTSGPSRIPSGAPISPPTSYDGSTSKFPPQKATAGPSRVTSGAPISPPTSYDGSTSIFPPQKLTSGPTPSRIPSGAPISPPTSYDGSTSIFPPQKPTSGPSRKPSGAPISPPTSYDGSTSIFPPQKLTSGPTPSRIPSGEPISPPTSYDGSTSILPPQKLTSGPTPSRIPSGAPISPPTSYDGSTSIFPPQELTSGPTPSRIPSGEPIFPPTSYDGSTSIFPPQKATAGPSRIPSGAPISPPTSYDGSTSIFPPQKATAGPSRIPSGAPISPPTSYDEPSSLFPPQKATAGPSRIPSGAPISPPTSYDEPSSLFPTQKPTAGPSRIPSGAPISPPTLYDRPTSLFPAQKPTAGPSRIPSGAPISPPTFYDRPTSLFPPQKHTSEPSSSIEGTIPALLRPHDSTGIDTTHAPKYELPPGRTPVKTYIPPPTTPFSRPATETPQYLTPPREPGTYCMCECPRV